MSTLSGPQELEDLGQMLATYNQVTEQLKESHDRLQEEVTRLRNELAAKNQQLQRRNRLAALGEMAAGLAHEIRNPLQGIRLYTDLLQQDFREESTALDLLEKVSAAIGTLDCLVSDVLAFTQTITCRKVALRMGAVIDQTLDLIGPLCNQAEVSLNVQDAIGDIALRGEAQLLNRVCLNLLINGIEAAGRGGTVTIGAKRIDRPWAGVQLQIADSGPGFAPEILDRIFDPFFTTKDQGTGIGLSIVHRIVEAHGGTITAANRPQGGAVITVRLPDADEPEGNV